MCQICFMYHLCITHLRYIVLSLAQKIMVGNHIILTMISSSTCRMLVRLFTFIYIIDCLSLSKITPNGKIYKGSIFLVRFFLSQRGRRTEE